MLEVFAYVMLAGVALLWGYLLVKFLKATTGGKKEQDGE